MGESNSNFQYSYTEEPRNYGSQYPVSTGKWVGIHFIKWIPFVGGIVYLVMLFIWAFGKDNQNETFRNWAKSELIMTAILVVLWVLMFTAFRAMVRTIYNDINNQILDLPMY